MSVKTDKKVCLVTGARPGIGKSISELLAKNGYRVILSPKRSGDCRDSINELTQKGFEVAELALDLSKPKELKKTLKNNIYIIAKSKLNKMRSDLYEKSMQQSNLKFTKESK